MFTDTPEQAQKKVDLANYKAAAAAERNAKPPQVAAPTPRTVTAGLDGAGGNSMANREEAAGLAGGGAIKGPKGAIRDMAKKKSADGAKLEGPGTPTSDSIPAEVVDTGEPIKVATGERIVSKKQDAFLLQQAKAAGFDSIDAWLEAGTGLPVGPTLKYTPEGDMPHAAGGGAIRRKMMPGRGNDPRGIRLGAPVAGYFGGGELGEEDAVDRDHAPNPSIPPAPTGPSVIRGGTQVPLSPNAGDQLANQSAMYVQGAQAANPQPVAQPITQPAAATSMPPQAASNVPDVGGYLPGEGIFGKAGRNISNMADSVGNGVRDLRRATNADYAPAKASYSNEGRAALQMGSAPAAPPPAQVAQATQTALPPTGAGAGRGMVNPAMGSAGDDVGGGITRFDAAGKSPLFTNMTDAAGMADNAKLMGRGAVSAQNQLAMNGIQARQDGRDQSALNKMQYDQEVAAAQSINEWTARGGRGLNALERGAIREDSTKRYEIDANTATRGDANQVAQQRLGLDVNADQRAATASGFQVRQQQRLETLHTRYESAKGPEREAIAEELRGLTGKDRPSDWKALALQGGTDDKGNKTEGILAAVNERTGEMKKFDQNNGLPPGMVKQIGTSNGKPVYEDKNGKQVMAKG